MNRFYFYVNGGESMQIKFIHDNYFMEKTFVYVHWNTFLTIPTIILRFLW